MLKQVKVLLAFMVAFVLLLVSSYILLPYYAGALLRNVLPDGYTLIELGVTRPTFRQLRIDQLILDSAAQGRITVYGLRVNYRPWALFNGQLERLHVDKITVAPVVEQKTTVVQSSSSVVDFATYLPSKWMLASPVQTVIIDHLAVVLPSSYPKIRDVQVALTPREWEVTGTISGPVPFNETATFSISVNQENRFHVNVTPADSTNNFGAGLLAQGQVHANKLGITVTLGQENRAQIPLGFLGQQYNDVMLNVDMMPNTVVQLSNKAIGLSDGSLMTRLGFQDTVIESRLSQIAYHFETSDAEGVFQLQVPSLALKGQVDTWALESAPFGFGGNFMLREQGQNLYLILNDNASVPIKQAHYEDYQVAHALLTAPAQQLEYDLKYGQYGKLLTPLVLEFGLEQAIYRIDDGEGIGIYDLKTSLSINQQTDKSYSVVWRDQGLVLQQTDTKIQLPASIVNVVLSLREPTTEAAFTLSNACGWPLGTGDWQRSVNGDQQANLYLNMRFSEEKTLQKFLNYPGFDVDFTAGEVVGEVRWLSPLGGQGSLSAQLTGEALFGFFTDATFRDVHLQFSSEDLLLSPWRYAELSLLAKQVDTGLVLSDTTLDAKAKMSGDTGEWQLMIDHIVTNALGGQVRVGDDILYSDRPSTITLGLDKLDLKQLMETQQVKDIEAEGLISGRIPVTLTNFEPSVGKGIVAAEQPGIIRYLSAPGLAEANPDLKIALDVLSNFNYDVLESELDYRSDGTMLLKSKIEGRNPDAAGGKQINLNLNTELNVKKALYALQIQKGLDKRFGGSGGEGFDKMGNLCDSP